MRTHTEYDGPRELNYELTQKIFHVVIRDPFLYNHNNTGMQASFTCFLSFTYFMFSFAGTSGSCTVIMPSKLVFPMKAGLVRSTSGAVFAVTLCCNPPALFPRLVNTNE